MELVFRNVNHAFYGLVSRIQQKKILVRRSPSRAGDVLVIDEPVTVSYSHPRERVLLNSARDANPFFHLFEALWMLAGRCDLEPLLRYNSRMAEFSDDGGITQPGAYGFRWRNRFGYDQLEAIVKHLKRNPESRRAVLQMWDACCCEEMKPLQRHDLYLADNGGKDVPCNTHAYFLIVDGRLNMTVCNRSNDLIWGMLGANVVHFSILQEYLAACIGVSVGWYHQFTNNLHVYTDRWEPEKWMLAETAVLREPAPLVEDPATFDREVKEFIDDYRAGWDEPFLQFVAKPMCIAFEYHKARMYDKAQEAVETVQCDWWRTAAREWIQRRKERYEAKVGANEA